MPKYDHLQTIFTHAMLSNLSALRMGTAVDITEDLQNTLHRLLHLPKTEKLIGVWDVIWGPAIAQTAKSHVADNTLYLAQKRGEAQYVISVAGTNPFSWYDWFNQDFAVSEVVKWRYNDAVANGVAISQGSDTGLEIMVGLSSNGTKLIEFLRNMVAAHDGLIDIAVAGHSLGGALAPVLALYLADTQADWNPAGKATLSVYPTAGPTSGTKAFADYYDGRLGDRTTRIWNTFDVVPHAWDHQLLDQVADLYSPRIKADELVRKVLTKAKNVSNGHEYGHIRTDTPGKQGEIHLGNFLEQLFAKGLDAIHLDFINFMDQITYQHVEAYFHLLETPELTEIVEVKLLKSLAFDLVATSREKIEKLNERLQTALGVADG